jgi:hypothetical protein
MPMIPISTSILDALLSPLYKVTAKADKLNHFSIRIV